MLKLLVIADNPLLPETWERVECFDIVATLQQRYSIFPDNARLYHCNVAQDCDVTPRSEEEIETLKDMPGPFYAVNYPEFSTLVIAAIIIVIAVIAIAVLAKPKLPTAANRNIQSESPNNALSGRTNSIRINGRIPDIFGQVRSTPDLIAVPYSVYENNLEIEYTYMCIGRGTYAINAIDVRDGTTPVSRIDGESVEIFGPDTSPNLPGAGPQLRIGAAITRRLISAVRSKSVNGQTLLAPNDGAINDITQTFDYVWPNKINSNGAFPDFTDTFVAGDFVYLTTALFTRYNENTNSTALPPFQVIAFSNETALGNNSVIQNHSVRFYADGRIEFQTISDIGTSTRPLNDDNRVFFKLSDAAVTDGVNNANLAGKYIATASSGSVLLCELPLSSTADWGNLSAFSGGVSPWHTCTFQFPCSPDVNLSGAYEIGSLVGTNQLVLVTPANTRANNDWNWLHYLGGSSRKDAEHAFISKSDGVNWIGPYILDVTTADELILNFVQLNGGYKDDGTSQTASPVIIEIGYAPCDVAGNPTGPESFVPQTMPGSATERGTLAATRYIVSFAPGRYAVRARRLTVKDLGFNGQQSDEVKWRDLYASSPVGNIAFGDITTVHCRTVGTKEALAVSERQINMLVTRMLPLRISGSTFATTLTATKSADEIISFICLDPKIGNRSKAEIDFNGIYATVADIKSYFTIDDAGEFSYTFDSDNLSFEDTLGIIAEAIFCTAHRERGSVISLKFEKVVDDSVILFNHRNKVPGSEIRTETFGNVDDFDGIEYEYVSPADDALVTYYVPENRSAVKPRKIQSAGVRSAAQAHLHAWREYNRILYQHLAVEFEATQEADVLFINDRIQVADNTRPDIQDGEITGQDGLILTLSQPSVLKDGVDYFISLQLRSGLVENIPVTAIDAYNVLLSAPPSETLVLDDDAVTATLYQLVKIEDVNKSACLVMSKDYGDSTFTCTVRAINYDKRYYRNDLDFTDTPYIPADEDEPPAPVTPGVFIPPPSKHFELTVGGTFVPGLTVGVGRLLYFDTTTGPYPAYYYEYTPIPYVSTVGDSSLANIAAGIASALTATGHLPSVAMGNVVTIEVAGPTIVDPVIEITGPTPTENFTISQYPGGSQKQISTYSLSGTVYPGWIYQLHYFRDDYSYTAVPGDTFANVMASFAAQLNAAPPSGYVNLVATDTSVAPNGSMSLTTTLDNYGFTVFLKIQYPMTVTKTNLY